MCDKKPKVTLSELIVAAVCYLQQKNGVSSCEITEYVAKKRCCKPCQIQSTINLVLCKAKKQGILCDKKGLFRIAEKYDDHPRKNKGKEKVVISDSDESDSCGEDDCNKDKCDPCDCVDYFVDNLKEEEQDDKCPLKKMKMG